MEEQEFRKHAQYALQTLHRALLGACDDYGFSAGLEGGAITVKFEGGPAKLVIAAKEPAQQICVSGPSKSYKLDWDNVESAFINAPTGQTLKQIVEQALSAHVHEEVSL